ncbi:hypothetical protein IAD21_03810 [Abditibacteriota bacterium]|nr:hypothetical protein IAD21_03810 [Abditibacteriota bacterium]
MNSRSHFHSRFHCVARFHVASVFGALSLLLLFLLGLSCPAQAGSWGTPTYVWSGSAHLQHLYYHPAANNLYNIDLTRTKNVLRGGVPVGPPANPNSPTRNDYGPPNQALVTWNNTGTAFAGDDNTHSGPVAPPAASSDANSSVFAVFHWQRQQINGHDDATDNPPQYVYMSERATLYAQRYTFAAGGSLTAYADTPWPADFVSVTGHAGSRDLQVNLNNANWQYDRQGFDTGTAYQYTLQASGTAVHRYAVQGDTVSLASVRFEGAVSLAPGYARPQDSARGLGAITCYYAATPLTLSLSATPVGPYSVIRNRPDDKEYNGTTRWAMDLTDDDGNFKVPDPPDPETPVADDLKAIHGQYVIDAQSAFTAVAARPDGTPIFPNQKFIWKSTPIPDKPVPLYFSVDHQPEILMYKSLVNGMDTYYSTLFARLDSNENLDALSTLLSERYFPTSSGTIMSPSLRDELLRHMEAAWRGSHPPDEQLLNTSTPTKDFGWNMGNANDYANFATAGKTSVVQAYVTGENADDPVIPVGKVKINWSRPKKCFWEVTIFPVTWRVPQGDGFVDLLRKIFTSNELLTENLELWGGEKIGQIALSAVGGVGGEAAGAEPIVIRVTTAEGVSGEVIADAAVERTKLMASRQAAKDSAIPQEAEGKFHVEVKQKGDLPEGESPQPSVEREGTVRPAPKGNPNTHWPVPNPTGDLILDKNISEIDDVNQMINGKVVNPTGVDNCGPCTMAAVLRQLGRLFEREGGPLVTPVASEIGGYPGGMYEGQLLGELNVQDIVLQDRQKFSDIASLRAYFNTLRDDQAGIVLEKFADGKEHWYNAAKGANGSILYDTQFGLGVPGPAAGSVYWGYKVAHVP